MGIDTHARTLERRVRGAGGGEAWLHELARLDRLGPARVAALAGDPLWRAELRRLGDGWVGLHEAARLFDVRPNTISAWCRAGCPCDVGPPRRFAWWEIYHWRCAEKTSWRVQEGLASLAQLAAHAAGLAPALRVATTAVEHVGPRWEALPAVTRDAAVELLALAGQPWPAEAALQHAHERLLGALPARPHWKSETYRLLQPVRLLADARLEASPSAQLRGLARALRSVVPALAEAGQGWRVSRDVTEACLLALKRWSAQALNPPS